MCRYKVTERTYVKRRHQTGRKGQSIGKWKIRNPTDGSADSRGQASENEFAGQARIAACNIKEVQPRSLDVHVVHTGLALVHTYVQKVEKRVYAHGRVRARRRIGGSVSIGKLDSGIGVSVLCLEDIIIITSIRPILFADTCVCVCVCVCVLYVNRGPRGSLG